MKRALVPVLAVFIASPAWADDLFLRAKERTVEGLATIDGGQIAAARNAAIADAQRSAVMMVLGVLVETRFSAEQQEALRGGHAVAYAKIEDSVRTKSTGYVESYDVIEERRDGSTYRVVLRVRIKAASLKDEIAELQGLLAKVGYPKIMIVAHEAYTGGSGARERVARPTLTAILEGELLRRGFELVDQARAPSLDEVERSAGDATLAAALGRRFGADVAIIGSAETKRAAYDEMGMGMTFVASTINVRAVHVATGRVLSSAEVVGRSAGASDELARVKAVRSGGPKVVDSLVADVVRSWKLEAQAGKRFRVNVLGIASYGKEGRAFLKGLRGIRHVEGVKELGLRGTRLDLELTFSGTKEQLLDAVFERLSGEFVKLDKVADRGDEFDLQI